MSPCACPPCRYSPLVALLGALLAPLASAGAPPTRASALVRRDTVAGGEHIRVATPRGPVHLWRPAGYRQATAGIVVFVHGYHIQADQAWERFRLAEQFQASRQNALFLVIEAPTSSEDQVRFPALSQLLPLVSRAARLKLPRGHLVAMGHSGAFRTLAEWLDYRWMDHLILLDALYAYEEQFAAWMESVPHASWHRMILVGNDTRARTELFLRRFRYAVRREDIPASVDGFSRRERRARLLYLRSQYGHTEIVSGGKVIPLLLRLTRLRRL